MNDVLQDIENEEIEAFYNKMFEEESFNEMMETEMWARG